MRRLYVLLLTLVVALSAMANPIDRQQARQQAEKFLQTKGMALGGEAARAIGRTSSTSKQPLYVFNASNNRGFVIVAGDDRVDPIIGYTTRGSFDDGDLPENFRAWLEGYAAQLKAIEANEAKPAKNMAARIQQPAIEPLIRTNWNQGNPYNLRTPTYKGDDGEYYHYVTGCVATALAQVMYYYQWPESCPAIPGYTYQSGKYSMPDLPATTFKWDQMKLKYDYDESGEAADAVAELMLYVGQANEMSYNQGGSAAYIHRKVMAETFGYSRNMYTAGRSDYTTAEWEDLIYQELAADRPVLYDGQSDKSGHQFICDGYDGDGFFHINWGWGGGSDGYFVLSLANPDEKGIGGGEGTGGYAYGQSAVIGFQPGSSDEPEIPRITFVARNFTAATYSRTSGDVDFEDITTNSCYFWASYNCDPTTTYPIEAGWALWQDGQILNVLATQEITIDNREGSTSYYGPETFSFGAGLADGSYRIVFVWRAQGSSDWTVASTKEALYAEISGNTLSIRGVNADPVTYTVNEVRYTGEMTQGTTNSATVNLTNTCDAYQQTVYFWMSNSGTWSLVGQGIGCVEPGQTGDVNLTFIQESPGTFDVKITSDDEGNEVMWTSTVTIYELVRTTIDGITYSYVADWDYTNIVDADVEIIYGNPLVIPASITVGDKTYRVKKIEDQVFYGIRPSSLTIEPGIEEIGSYNFWNVNGLKELVIPEGVKIIGNSVFQYCYGLREVTLPSTLTSLGDYAFGGCYRLTTVTSNMIQPCKINRNVFTYKDEDEEFFIKAALYVPVGTKANYQHADGWKEFSPIYEGRLETTTIDGITYSYVTTEDFANIVDADEEMITDNPLVIRSTITVDGKTYKVKKIENNAFYGTKPSSLTIEPGIEEIGNYNFWNVNSLREVVIPEGVKVIGNCAFQYCFGLRELTLPSTLTSLGDDAFGGCSRLTTVSSYMAKPCDISRNVFMADYDNDTFSSATLNIPVGTKQAYLNAEGWKEFGDNIAETLPAPGEEKEVDGDANSDGEVNVADIDYVIERIGADYETNKAADVNGDSQINVADVDYIIERIN